MWERVARTFDLLQSAPTAWTMGQFLGGGWGEEIKKSNQFILLWLYRRVKTRPTEFGFSRALTVMGIDRIQ